MKKIITALFLLLTSLAKSQPNSMLFYMMQISGAAPTCGTTCVTTYPELDAALSNSSVNDITIQPGTFLLEDTLVITRSIHIRGAGKGITVLKLDTSLHVNVAFYVAASGSSNVTIEALTIDGQSPAIDTNIITTASQITTNTGMGNQYGIKFGSLAVNPTVLNVDVKNLNAVGIDYGGPGGGSSNFAQSGFFDNCTAINCYHGFKVDSAAEYSRWTNLRSLRCVSGFTTHAGNTIVSDSHFTENIINAYIGDGPNNSHGSFSNCFFNHGLKHDTASHKAIYANGANIAETFTGGGFYDGDVYLVSCSGFSFSNMQVAGRVIAINGGQTQVSGSPFYFAGIAPYGAGTVTASGTATITLKNNFWTNGSSPTGINN